MKFKPIALLVIGLLLGSVVTQYFAMQSSSTTEILACVSKSTGKTRLTTSGTCDNKTEMETPLTDLWSLLPTTSAPPSTTPLKKYVVDATGKVLGDLVKEDGLSIFAVRTKVGIWNYGVSYPNVSGYMNKVNLYFDSKCKSPFLAGYAQSERNLQTAIDGERETVGYLTVGAPLPWPKKAWRTEQSQVPNTQDRWETKCVLWNGENELVDIEGGASFFRSVEVAIPTYTPPLKIVEK